MDGLDVLRRLNRNLGEYVKLLADAAPGGAWQQRDGLLIFAGAHPYPGTHTNGVLRLTNEVPAPDVLARADAFFAPRRHSYTIWIRDDWDADLEAAVAARGFQLHPPEAGLPVLALAAPASEVDHPLDPAGTMRRVEDGRGAVDFLTVIARAFGMDVPPPVMAKIFFHPKTLLDPRVDAFVAYLDEEPVSVCLSFYAAGYSGLYNGGTLRRARGRGLARATFRTAAAAGFGRGARYAGGTSSELGAPVWLHMGCETFAHWRRWYGQPA